MTVEELDNVNMERNSKMKEFRLQFYKQDEKLPIDYKWNNKKMYVVLFKSGEQGVCHFWPLSWSKRINKTTVKCLDACINWEEFKDKPNRTDWKFNWNWQLVYTNRYYSSDDVVGWCELPDLAKAEE